MIHFDKDLFRINNKTAPGQGLILVSEPLSQDAYFRRSVILLTEHNEEGTVGFILNKSTEVKIKDALEEFEDASSKLSIGGPVAPNTIHYIHTLGDIIPGSIRVLDNLFWGGDFDKLKELVKLGVIDFKQIRFFMGYSGWEPKQLDRELSENLWIVASMDSRDVLHAKPEKLYKKVIDRLGDEFRLWANVPADPAMN